MELYKHQQDLLARNPKRWLLAWECGTAKSRAVIELAQKNCKSILVVTPKSLKENFENQIKKWSSNSDIKWLVLTKENFKKQADKLERYDCVCLDEGHFWGNYKSQLHKKTLGYLRKYQIGHVYILTATPYTSSVWSIYSIGLLLGKNWEWYQWKNKFFIDVGSGRMKFPVQKTKVDGINIKDYVVKLVNILGNTVNINQCGEVPEQTELVEFFDVLKDQKDAISNLTDTTFIALWTKKHCIENSVLKSDGYTEDKFFRSEKINRIVELCNEHKKIAIVCRYNLQIANIKNVVGDRKVFIINGETKNKQQVSEEVNNCDNCVVLIQGATAEGYNLWTVPIMVFASLDFSSVKLEQVKGRILRGDHLKKNIYIYLVNRKPSVDYDVYQRVAVEKQDFTYRLYNN